MIRPFSQLFQTPLACLVYLALLILLPLTMLTFFWKQYVNLRYYQEEIERIHNKNLFKETLQKKETLFLDNLKRADHAYIDKYLENFIFLEPEIRRLEAEIVENPLNKEAVTRLKFLKSQDNRLVFIEEKTRKASPFQEMEEKQHHSVEMNEEDLKRMLSLIEAKTIWPYGPKEHPPQLIIKNLELTKKEVGPQEKVFVVRIDLLRRECAP